MFDSQLHSPVRNDKAFKEIEWNDIHIYTYGIDADVRMRMRTEEALCSVHANCQSFIGKRIAYKPILVLTFFLF